MVRPQPALGPTDPGLRAPPLLPTTAPPAAARSREAPDGVVSGQPPPAMGSPAAAPPPDFYVQGVGPLPAERSAIAARVFKAATAQGLESIERRLLHVKEGLAYINARTVDDPQTSSRGARVETALGVVGELRAERAKIERRLTPHLVQQAGDMVAANRARIETLRATYIGSETVPPQTPLQDLRAATRTLLELRRDLEASPTPEGARDFLARRRELAAAHPLLGEIGVDAAGLSILGSLAAEPQEPQWDEAFTRREAPDALQALLDDTERAGQSLLQKLQAQPEAAWSLPLLVDAALDHEGLDEFEWMLAMDVARYKTLNAEDRQRAWTVLNLGASAAGNAAASAAAVLAGPALGADIFDLHQSLGDLSLRLAAHNMSWDQTRRLAHDAPSGVWLGVEAAAVALGAASMLRGVDDLARLHKTSGLRALGGAVHDAPGGFRRTIGWSGEPVAHPPPGSEHLALIRTGMDTFTPRFRKRLDKLAQMSTVGADYLHRRIRRLTAESARLATPPPSLSKAAKADHQIAKEVVREELVQARAALSQSMEDATRELRSVMGQILVHLKKDVPRAEARAWAQTVRISGSARKREPQIRKALADFYQIAGKTGAPEELFIVKVKDRAGVDMIANVIDIGGGSSKELWHELGHFLEDRRETTEAAYTWLKARAIQAHGKVELALLKDRFPEAGYQSDERIVLDHLIEEYAGKIATGYSEVVSTGLEMFRNPDVLARFLVQDPEHFFFILGVINSSSRR